jgi:short-subunit dehydrogenase
VVVTGASSGVGAALARAFAAEGAHVALFARSEDGLEAVACDCRRAGGEALVVPGDATVPDDGAELVRRTIETFGRLDVVVAAAGLGMRARFDELADTGVLRRLMDVNYLGVANVFLPALPHVVASAGSLVAISSLQGVVGVPERSGYVASKHALEGLCATLRIELRGSGVTVTTVLANWVRGTNLRAKALGPDGRPRGTAADPSDPTAVDLDELTEEVLRAVRRRQRRVFVPGWTRALAWLAAIWPGLAERVVVGRTAGERTAA